MKLDELKKSVGDAGLKMQGGGGDSVFGLCLFSCEKCSNSCVKCSDSCSKCSQNMCSNDCSSGCSSGCTRSTCAMCVYECAHGRTVFGDIPILAP